MDVKTEFKLTLELTREEAEWLKGIHGGMSKQNVKAIVDCGQDEADFSGMLYAALNGAGA